MYARGGALLSTLSSIEGVVYLKDANYFRLLWLAGELEDGTASISKQKLDRLSSAINRMLARKSRETRKSRNNFLVKQKTKSLQAA